MGAGALTGLMVCLTGVGSGALTMPLLLLVSYNARPFQVFNRALTSNLLSDQD